MQRSIMDRVLLACLVLLHLARAQFLLPQTPQEAPKAKIPADLEDYFSIQPGSSLINTFLPGFVPPPNYVIEGKEQPNFQNLGNTLTGLSSFNGPLPGLTGSQLSRLIGGDGNRSSTAGIPDIFPTLPRPPVPDGGPSVPGIGVTNAPNPLLQGGFGLGGLGGGAGLSGLTGLTGLPQTGFGGFGSSASGLDNSGLGWNGLGGARTSQFSPPFQQNPLLGAQQRPQNGNLLSQLLTSLGLGELAPSLDIGGLNQALNASPQAAGGDVLSSVLYSALTDSAAVTKDNSTQDVSKTVKANAAVIQNLLTQSSSPLCNPKPQPLQRFSVDAFMGKYYQVLYSPPMSLGPCSMITFSKLSDIGRGGPGTVFNLFEYTTEGTPNGRPRISSGYGIIRAPGEMIFRTSNTPSDLNVFVIDVGPQNEYGQYDYVVLAINCNYPLYVYARDPIQYKQKYEPLINSMLERRGLATSWARLFNIVAPVDYNLCSFPPTLFNIPGFAS